MTDLQSLRDDDLAGAATHLLCHDSRTGHLDVRVRSDGCVLHLTGSVDTWDELDTVREVLGRMAGVLAIWDRVRVAGEPPTALDLGCGGTPQYATNICVDRRRTEQVDVRADLAGGLPFRDHTVERIYAVHVLEHLADFLPLLDECHRVLRPHGILHILSPWWRHVNAVADPTHLRLLDVQTIKGICARADSELRWYPLHAAHDQATVFADLTPLAPSAPAPSAHRMARFFD